MLANVGKCWPTFLIQFKNVVQTGQHIPTCTNIRQHLPTFANKVKQTFPTCCANNVGAMLANMLRWFKPALRLHPSKNSMKSYQPFKYSRKL